MRECTDARLLEPSGLILPEDGVQWRMKPYGRRSDPNLEACLECACTGLKRTPHLRRGHVLTLHVT